MPVRYPNAFSVGRNRRSALEVPGNVLEIPSIYNAPTREDVVRRVDPATSDCCPCSGPQGMGPRSQPQNPYALPGPQNLGEPAHPQKPFQPPQTDPCAMNDEILRGLGIDPDCLGGRARKSASPRKSPSRGRNNPKARSARAKQKTGSSRKKRKGTMHTVKKSPSAAGARYRVLSNGACYDTTNRRFVKKSNC